MSDSSPPARSSEPAPTFGDMPGLTKAAVVLMWVLFGFSACGSVVITVGGLVAASQLGLAEIPFWLELVLVLDAVQLVVWTVLRGVFAVRIRRRRGSARIGAVVLESIGLGLTVLIWIATTVFYASHLDGFSTSLGTEVTISTDPEGVGGSCSGIVLSILVIAFLSSKDSKRWCDR